MEAIAFYTFSLLTISMFYITVMTKKPLYSLSSLAAGMIFISGFFFLLGAEFLGAVQIVVYTGAVMALYAFGMMFFDTTKDIKEKIENPNFVMLLTVSTSLLIVAIISAPILGENIEALYSIDNKVGNIQAVGMVLFTKYLIPFEVAAVMLLVAMIAGIVLAGKKMDTSITLLSHDEEEREFEDLDKIHNEVNS
jgi:NADH-quinone oxidoreductase subunit J